MYSLYNFHLLNKTKQSYNLKISPEVVEHPTLNLPAMGNNAQVKPLQISRNFLSIITNATHGKSCSSCGGR